MNLDDLIVFEKTGEKRPASFGDHYIDHTDGNSIRIWTRKHWPSMLSYEIVRQIPTPRFLERDSK